MPSHRQFLRGLVFSLLLAWPAAAAEPGVQWMQDIESAKAVAQQTGRLVLVHFWTPECVPCRALDMNVFNQPGVAAALQSQYVPVKLNANENPGTAQGFGVTHVPTDVVLTPQGQVVAMSLSPSTPSAYVAGMAQVARQSGQRQSVYQNVATTAPQAPQLSPQLNAAYANLQFGTPPQGSGATGGFGASAQPSGLVASTVAVRADQPPVAPGPTVNSTPYTWTAGGSQVAVGAPLNASAPTGGQPGGYASSYQAPPPAAQVATTNRAYGPQTWPSTAPPTASTAPQMTVQNSQAGSGTVPSQTAGPYATWPVGPSQMSAVTTAPSSPVTPAAQPATPATQADTRRLPPGAPPLGFDGYCPVSMRGQWKWVAGDPKWGAIHRGRTYWFAGQREQQQFLANPDFFSPALSGIDPVLALDHGQVVPGMREHALDYDNQFYLFSSEATLQQFTGNPARYAEQVRQAMSAAPGNLVR
jgi:YHS domain-containing protein/thiol-disulfide isomerase/thioredoxin